jgi:hypothetical protein
MPQIKNAEIWYAKVDPKRPNRKFNKKNPTWEIQIRTTDKNVKKRWDEMHLPVKRIVPEDDDGNPTGDPYWRVNLRKRTIKSDGEAAAPVEVCYGDMSPVDPGTIGNGSLGNVRIYQYEFDNDGEKGIASVLMGIQLTKHIRYTPKNRDDDFEETETEIVEEEESEENVEEGGEEDTTGEQPSDEETAEEVEEKAPAKKPTPSLKKKTEDFD